MGNKYSSAVVLAAFCVALGGAGCSAEVDADESVASAEQDLFISTCFATGTTATATSTRAGTTNVPSKAVDTSQTTRWESSWKDDESITVDLGASMIVYGTTLNWEGACGKDYDIDVAAGAGGPWTNGIQVRGNTTGGGKDLIFPNGGITGRFVRMHGLKRCQTAYGFSLYDISARVGTVSCVVDNDNDGFRAPGSACGVCPASQLPTGDCDDWNNKAKPNQTVFQSTAHSGSWDYNCNGGVEIQSTSGATLVCVDVNGNKTSVCSQCVYSFAELNASDCGQQRCSLQGTEQVKCL